MTIQNIEDVMDRIMNLNKNLNEESLKTLLSASGWDKEDIMEGLHIFRSTKGNLAPAVPNFYQPSPIPVASAPVPPAPIQAPIPTPNYSSEHVENSYTFNLTPESTSEVKVQDEKEINHIIKNEETTAPTSGIIPNTLNTAPVPSVPLSSFLPEPPKRSSHIVRKIIFFVILILIGILLYLFTSTNIKNKSNNIVENSTNTNQIIDAIPPQTDQNFSTSTDIAQDNSNDDLTQSQINDLIKEVNTLKTQLATYKNSGQTIVKYVSQRGPTGMTGKGVSSIDATTTGFVINYTDKTSTIVPYSTTTILNILNSSSVCFRDQNATTTNSTTSDVCLDRNSVLNLLNK